MSSSAEGGGGANVSGSASGKKKMPKNSSGSRQDVAWKHEFAVESNKSKIKCKYCNIELWGGAYRLKHHLAGTSKDVSKCIVVPDDVKEEMMSIVTGLQKKLITKKKRFDVEGSDGCLEGENVQKRQEIGSGTSSGSSQKSIFSRQMTQTTMSGLFNKERREEAAESISRFFYNNAIPFNVANSEEYLDMFEKVARHGIGFKPPSYYEIRVKYLKKEVKVVEDAMEEHKQAWKKTGCTIMSDGWTDKRRRTIINFLVNSPKGTVFLESVDASHISKTVEKVFKMIDEVIEKVGEDNVVQVVTDNAANYKAAGELLMEKGKKLYWTPCAAHCIDLMLEDFEKKMPIHKDTISKGKKITTYIYSRTSLITLLHNFTKGKDLIRPGATRFATSYLTLGCLNENKGALMRMFTSNDWNKTQCKKTKDGKFIEDVVLDKGFWKSVIVCLKGTFPLIKVLRLVDADDPPAMRFIYEEMDKAKEKIQSAFNSNKKVINLCGISLMKGGIISYIGPFMQRVIILIQECIMHLDSKQILKLSEDYMRVWKG